MRDSLNTKRLFLSKSGFRVWFCHAFRLGQGLSAVSCLVRMSLRWVAEQIVCAWVNSFKRQLTVASEQPLTMDLAWALGLIRSQSVYNCFSIQMPANVLGLYILSISFFCVTSHLVPMSVCPVLDLLVCICQA